MRHQIKYFSPMHFEIWSVEICSGGGSFEICSAMLHSSAWAVLELTPSFLFQIPHVHHVRAFINQPVRTDQEEQVPGVFSAAGAQVCTQLASVSGHPVQKQNNPLWYEAGERATQAAGSLWHQGKISVLYACLSTLWNQSWPGKPRLKKSLLFAHQNSEPGPHSERHMQIYAAVN